jgi:hypothetical protein
MIAEQILNKKPMRNLSYVDYKQLKENLTNNTFNLENIWCNSLNSQVDNEINYINEYEKIIIKDDEVSNDDIPEWLKNDVEECEFIPIEALNKSIRLKTQPKIKDKEANLVQDNQKLDEVLRELDKLKLENNLLKQQVSL